MAKLRLYGLILLLLIASVHPVSAQYALHVRINSPDSVLKANALGIPSSFKDRALCTEYIYKLTDILRNKGFTAASIDSIQMDSAAAFLQTLYWRKIHMVCDQDKTNGRQLTGRGRLEYQKNVGKPATLEQFQSEELVLLNWLENNGYPFAKIFAGLRADKPWCNPGCTRCSEGPLYKIDSIHINGTAKISVDFMERYLGIPEGSIYKKDRLLSISKRIMELPFVQEERPWNV
ncbi:MAG: hypothetical protein WDM78_22380 [Puia sp.]